MKDDDNFFNSYSDDLFSYDYDDDYEYNERTEEEVVETISRAMRRKAEEEKQKAERRQSTAQHEKKKQSTKQQKKAGFLTGVILTGLVTAGAIKISKMEMTDIYTESRTIQVDILLDDVEQISQLAESREVVINANLFTGLTAHEESTVGQYSTEKQLEREDTALSGYKELENIHQVIDENLEVIRDESTTQEQKREAIENLNSAVGEVNQIYEGKEDLIHENVENFTRATLTAEDEKSAMEIEIAQSVEKNFDETFEKVSEVSETFSDMSEQMNTSETTISDVQEGENGEYITVTMVQELVKTRELKGISALMRKIKKLFCK